MVAKFNGNYYRIKEGEEIPKMPEELKNSLIASNYVEEDKKPKAINEKKQLKKSAKKEEVIPEEDLSTEELSNIDPLEEVSEEEHIIKKESSFLNFFSREEDTS